MTVQDLIEMNEANPHGRPPGRPPEVPPGRPPGLPPGPSHDVPPVEPPGRIRKPAPAFGGGRPTAAGSASSWLTACQQHMAEMVACYPGWKCFRDESGIFWEGRLQGLPPSLEDAANAVTALYWDDHVFIRDGTVYATTKYGSLPPNITLDHVRRIVQECRSYQVQVRYRRPPGVPMARCINPEVSRKTHPAHPHLYADGSVCPFLPSSKRWAWGENTLVDFVDDVAIWVAKHQVYEVTGKWIGPAISHDPEHLVRSILPNAPCHCGSGKPYSRCHRYDDWAQIAQKKSDFRRFIIRRKR